jgi:hypothetical protein
MIQKMLRPFLTLSDSEVHWEARSDGRVLNAEHPTVIDDWHPGLELPLTVQLKFDKKAAVSTLLIESLEPKFGVYATAFSSATGYKWVSEVSSVVNDSEEFSFTLPSQVFALNLRIEFSLVLLSRTPGGSGMSPRANSVLSRASFLCTLEGESTRPSVALVEFTDNRISDSFWEIESNFPNEISDLEQADISTAFTIKINQKLYEKHCDEISYIRGLASDFLNVIIECSLANDELAQALIDESDLSNKGSLWVSCKIALTAIFGDSDFFSVSNEYAKKQSYVRARIQMVSAKTLGIGAL